MPIMVLIIEIKKMVGNTMEGKIMGDRITEVKINHKMMMVPNKLEVNKRVDKLTTVHKNRQQMLA